MEQLAGGSREDPVRETPLGQELDSLACKSAQCIYIHQACGLAAANITSSAERMVSKCLRHFAIGQTNRAACFEASTDSPASPGPIPLETLPLAGRYSRAGNC